jgi:O-antigen/teichoic acid export membrane protein
VLGQPHRIPEVLRTAIRPVLAVSVAAAVALALLAAPVARLLAGGGLGQAGASPADVAGELRLLAVALPFAALLDTLAGATRGYRAMGPTVAVDRIGRPVLQLAGIGVAAAAGSAALLAPLWALPYVPAAVIIWLWLHRVRRRHPAPDTSAAGSLEPLRFWRFTVPRGLAALAQITIQRVDIVLVAVLRGPAAAAVYTAATRFLVAGQFGNQAIAMAAQPRFTEMFTAGDRAAANRVYQATTAWLILLTWPLYLLAVAFGPQVIEVFGRSYSAGTAVIVILGLTMLLATGCGQVDMVLVTTGRSWWSLANGLLAVAVNVALDLVLIPAYGITGAAIGWSAAIALTNLLPLAQIAATQRLHPFSRGTAIAAALTALCFGLLPLAARTLAGHAAAPSLAAIGYGCVAMAVGMWCFRAELNLTSMPGAAHLTSMPGAAHLAGLLARRRTARPAQRPGGIRSSSGSVLMFKVLVILLWPVGILAILVLTALSVKRWARVQPPVTVAMNGHGDTLASLRAARSSIVGMLLILTVGALAVYAVMCLLGVLVVHGGPSIDKPVYMWMTHHRVHVWKAAMDRVTKMGNTWTTWGAAAAAAACLAVFYRRQKWLPPVVLAAAVFIDHYLTLALRHTFHRLGPPDSPLGTYPSGGCDRVILFYGLIAYLIWREVSARRGTAAWLAGVVAAAGFTEAYSRVYLTLHWFTDAVSGLIYGSLLLAVFIATIRLVDGPARKVVKPAAAEPAAMSGQPAPAPR